jgi:hypothetical protein
MGWMFPTLFKWSCVMLLVRSLLLRVHRSKVRYKCSSCKRLKTSWRGNFLSYMILRCSDSSSSKRPHVRSKSYLLAVVVSSHSLCIRNYCSTLPAEDFPYPLHAKAIVAVMTVSDTRPSADVVARYAGSEIAPEQAELSNMSYTLRFIPLRTSDRTVNRSEPLNVEIF